MTLHVASGITPRQGGGTSLQSPASLALSPAALFTETPHDMTAQAGEDVEMACSFRGTGSPSYSLEIQWWYVRNHKDWTDKQTWASNQVKSLVLPLRQQRQSPPRAHRGLRLQQLLGPRGPRPTARPQR